MYIAVDIGGTQLRAALYPEDGLEPLVKRIVPTEFELEKPEDRLLDLITSVWPANHNVKKIGVGVAGPVNPNTGEVFYAPNISGWMNFPLGDMIEKKFNTITLVGNDANLAALGEWKYGAGVGHHDLIYLTISTGIGGGIIIDDRLLVGPRGIAGEVGHITVLPDGPMCGCGKRGHLEAVASGTGIANYVRLQLANSRSSVMAGSDQNITSRMVKEAADKGDELALEAFEYAGKFLGLAIADLLHLFEPTMVVLGGGVTKAGEYLMKPVRKSLNEGVFSPEYLRGFEMALAKLGDQAGLVGALALARHQD
jgi:glucokinase